MVEICPDCKGEFEKLSSHKRYCKGKPVEKVAETIAVASPQEVITEVGKEKVIEVCPVEKELTEEEYEAQIRELQEKRYKVAMKKAEAEELRKKHEEEVAAQERLIKFADEEKIRLQELEVKEKAEKEYALKVEIYQKSEAEKIERQRQTQQGKALSVDQLNGLLGKPKGDLGVKVVAINTEIGTTTTPKPSLNCSTCDKIKAKPISQIVIALITGVVGGIVGGFVMYLAIRYLWVG